MTMVAIEGKPDCYDGAKAIEVFDGTKAGVKGLVDSGIRKIPRFFIHSPLAQPKRDELPCHDRPLAIPVIDLEGINGNTDRRAAVAKEIKRASETWGFFQMVNHGVPVSILDEMIQGVKRFNEQPTDSKKGMYSRDMKRRTRFCTSGVLASRLLTWKDSLACSLCDEELAYEELPLVCRNILVEYVSCVVKLKDTLSELLSEALGLHHDYLNRMGCMKMQSLVAHYYPKCPEPDLAVGTMPHSDPHILTILLQDDVGGLQILHQGKWVDVHPLHGSLLANVGDLLQIISNDKFKSVEHRVLAQEVGPRVSVATFASPDEDDAKLYGPIKDLLTKENRPVYKETTLTEYRAVFQSCVPIGNSAVPHFKL